MNVCENVCKGKSGMMLLSEFSFLLIIDQPFVISKDFTHLKSGNMFSVWIIFLLKNY